MLKRKNKKGFTLAELLIVVAIIAVLVAIAVPLFVGAVNDAEARVGEANCRAVRGTAVEEILMDSQRLSTDSKKKNYGTTGPWYAYALVSSDGSISDLKIQATNDTGLTLTLSAGDNKAAKTIPASGDATAGYTKDGSSYKVIVKITELTVS